MLRQLSCMSLAWCVVAVVALPSALAQPKPPFPLPPKPPFAEKPPGPPELLRKIIADLSASEEADRLDAAEKLRELAAVGAGIATEALTRALDDQSEHVRFAALYALAGIGPEAKKALPAVQSRIKNAEGDYERVLAAWAATQITSDRSELVDLIPALTKALGSDNEAVANQAAVALSEFGRVAEPHLAKALSGADSRTSVLVLEALGRTGARGAVDQIAQLLDADDAATRAAAARALGDIGPASKSAVAALQKLLANDESAVVRARAAYALGRIGVGTDEISQSLAAATSDKDDAVARTAIASLVRLDTDSSVIIDLMPKLLADERPSVMTEALVALAEQGEAALPVLKAALQDKDTQYFALLVISDIGPAASELVPVLAEMLSEAEPLTKREILMALAKIGPGAADAIPKIVPTLSDDEKTVQYAATFAVGNIGTKSNEAVAALTKNLKSDDEFLKMTSAWAFAKLEPNNPLAGLRAIQMLASGLVSKDPALQQAASQCLADLKPGPATLPQLLPKIAQAFGSDDRAVRQSALDAIEAVLGGADPGRVLAIALRGETARPLAALAVQRFGPKAKAAAPALVGALDDTRPEVRRDVAMAIAAIGSAADMAVPALVGVADNDDDPQVRRAAVFALGKIGPTANSGVKKLRELAGGSDDATKNVAAWALAFIAPDDVEAAKVAVPVLVGGLESERADERQQSAAALGEFGSAAASALDALNDATQDPDPAVRAAALEAIEAVKASGN